MHGKAKEQAEIDGEKEIVETSTIQAMGKNKYGDVTQNDLEEKLNSNAGDGKAEVIDNGDTLVVKFIDSERYYEVDSDGNVSEPVEMVIDEYAGDLTKGGRCDGSETKPYAINCIEDLVAFSNMTNGSGYIYVGTTLTQVTESNTFSGKYVVLTRDLDFKSIFSYNDYKTTSFGDINGDSSTDGLMIELTTGTGFNPINVFSGTLNGQGYKISNLYIYRTEYEDDVGFIKFGKIATIKDLGICGYIYGNAFECGGFIACANSSIISNCYFEGKIENVLTTNVDGNWNDVSTGGIVGSVYASNSKPKITNCYNKGTIIGPNHVGGILGYTYLANPSISFCYNSGEIVATDGTAGGIIGTVGNSSSTVIESYNTANILGVTYVGGIIGYMENGSSILACYNSGKINSQQVSSGIGYNRWVGGTYNYCYNIGELIGNTKYPIARASGSDINCYYLPITGATEGVGSPTTEGYLKGTEEKDEKTFLEILNEYVKENEGWAFWKSGDDGYPTIDFNNIN